MPRAYGEVVYTLTDLKIAAYNIVTGVIGTAVDLPEQQTLEVTFNHDTDKIKAGGRTTHSLSVLVDADFTLSSAGIPFEALALMTGWTRGSSGSTPNQQETLKGTPGGAGMPYFTMAGKMAAENGADLHVGLKCCQLNAAPGWTGEQNTFIIAECAGTTFAPEDTDKLPYVEKHETAAAINLTTLFA